MLIGSLNHNRNYSQSNYLLADLFYHPLVGNNPPLLFGFRIFDEEFVAVIIFPWSKPLCDNTVAVVIRDYVSGSGSSKLGPRLKSYRVTTLFNRDTVTSLLVAAIGHEL